jgi:hypothetical protein
MLGCCSTWLKLATGACRIRSCQDVMLARVMGVGIGEGGGGGGQCGWQSFWLHVLHKM